MSKYLKIGKLVQFNTKGITPKYVVESTIMVLNQKCIRNNRIDFSLAQYTDDSKGVSENKIIRIGDILINSTGQGTAGRCAFVDKIPEGVILIPDSHILILRCKNYDEARCLNYNLFHSEPFIQTFMDGSTGQGELDKVRLFNLNVPIPSSESTQQKIASVLSSLDAKIELNNRINAELEAMAKTLYDYWFVQFDFPNAEGKPYKSSGGAMVWSEELKREIPQGWRVDELSNLFQFNPTLSLKKGAISSYIDMDALPIEGYMTKSVQKKEFNGGVKFNNGDLIVSRITPCLENGKTGLITLLEGNEVGFGSTEFIVLRGKEMPLSGFASFLARSDLFRKYAIANMLGTSGRKRVEASALAKFLIAIPQNEVLKKFEEFTTPIFQQTTANVNENQQLAQLRDWLLPMLMNGQVVVE